MSRKFKTLRKTAIILLSSGMLLQAGTCAFQPDQLAAGLSTALLSSVVSSFVFNYFGVGTP